MIQLNLMIRYMQNSLILLFGQIQIFLRILENFSYRHLAESH